MFPIIKKLVFLQSLIISITGVILEEVPTPPFISLAAAADEKHLITAEDLCL